MSEKSLTVAAAFVGKDLEFLEGPLTIYLDSSGKTITSIEKSANGEIDLSGYLAIPALANMHVHGLDYSIAEEGYDLDIDSLVGEPYGLKYALLKKVSDKTLCSSLRSFIREVRSYGVGYVVEFRELGLRGLKICKGNEKGAGHFILAMPETHYELSEEYVDRILSYADGVGVSSPLYFSPKDLRTLYLRSRKAGKLFFSHASETKETHESDDFKLLFKVGKPDAVIHGTWLTTEELSLLHDSGVTLVLCLRSNLWFLSGLPNLREIHDLGISVSLGTDNGGWIQPDLWREAELLYLLLRKEGIDDPNWVLKALINTSSIHVENYLKEGNNLNMTLIQYVGTSLERAKNKVVALIKRGDRDLVRCVVVNGSVVYERFGSEKALCHGLRDNVS